MALQQNPFKVQQGSLGFNATITRITTHVVGGHYPMARDDDGYRVGAAGRAHGAGRAAQGFCYFSISYGFTIRNLFHYGPYTLLEFGSWWF